MRKGWVAVMPALVSLVGANVQVDAATATPFRLTSLSVKRGVLACPPNLGDGYCTPIPQIPKEAPEQVRGKWACAGTSLASVSPTYECRVIVGAQLTGTAPNKVPVALAFSVTSDDGNPWNDDVRRTMRGTPQLTQPPASGAPAPCSLIPAQEPRVSCAKAGPKTWTARTSTSTDTGLYSVPMQVVFRSMTSPDPVCEYLRIIATATFGKTTYRVDLGRRRFCA